MPEPRPPRILFCSDTYPPQVSGVSVVTALSVAGLRARVAGRGCRATLSGRRRGHDRAALQRRDKMLSIA